MIKLFRKNIFSNVKQLPIETKPMVITRSRIKPTKCERCLSVYQASFEHIDVLPDICRIDRVVLGSRCPVCKYPNAVEFEEGE